jgi:hypothetical protein
LLKFQFGSEESIYTRSSDGNFLVGTPTSTANGDTCRLEQSPGNPNTEYPVFAACKQSLRTAIKQANISRANPIDFGDAFHCAGFVGFPDGQSLLKFVDDRVAAGKSPVLQRTVVNGTTFTIPLSLQITGAFVYASAGSHSESEQPLPMTRATTVAEISLLKDLLTKRVHGTAIIGTMAAGDLTLHGGQVLTARFNTVADLRDYVASTIAADESPAPIAVAREKDALAMAIIMSVGQE